MKKTIAINAIFQNIEATLLNYSKINNLDHGNRDFSCLGINAFYWHIVLVPFIFPLSAIEPIGRFISYPN